MTASIRRTPTTPDRQSVRSNTNFYIRKSLHTKPLHQARTMDLHRADADIQIVGYRLVGSACQEASQHLVFPWAERGNSFDCLSHFRLVPQWSWMGGSIVNHRQKRSVVERLLDKVRCA